ncbi:MAG: shikimate dehydrogenase [Candidatus Omnitrophica bacterium]|nr:shikimate dehydrogenase [Candidatus Omnitrophota bacterium]
MARVSSKKIYGVLGYPARHSLSPQMHNAAFRFLKINAEYRIFEVKPEELDTFVNTLAEENIFGFNVTIPYKERIMDFVKPDRVSSYLRQIKAVNTVVFQDGVWKGFNTDISGFKRDLDERGVSVLGKSAALLGAGGAGRAVAYVLANNGAKDITVYDVDAVRAKSLIELINGLFFGFKINYVTEPGQLDIPDKDILVNATPVGMKESDPIPVEPEVLHPGLFVYDLIYNPAQTKLIRIAKDKGAKTANGLGMLLYQGALSFEYFTGMEAPVELMRQALEEGVKGL